MLTSAFGSSKKRKAMETRLRHEVEKYVLEGALNSAVDTGLVQAETHKAREGKHTSVSPEHRNLLFLTFFSFFFSVLGVLLFSLMLSSLGKIFSKQYIEIYFFFFFFFPENRF